jgi:hypothetical protein
VTMARTRLRIKGRRESRSFSKLIHDYFESQQYASLSPRAVKVLVDLYCQYRGNNNGDLCAAKALMAQRGWRSSSQLQKALKELLQRGWIVVTRQGGRHAPTLYAVTFVGIDFCGGKLDVAANPVAGHDWKRANQANVIEFPRSRRGFAKKIATPPADHSGPPQGPIQVFGFAQWPSTRVNRGPFWSVGGPRHGPLLRIYQEGHGFKQAA